MKINVLICCVNNGVYAQYLRQALPVWCDQAASVTVVTDHNDDQTPEIVIQNKAILHRTNIFYEDGRVFGKSAAMEEARQVSMPLGDWALFADADIIPQVDWLDQIEAQNPCPGNLYGCNRMMDTGRVKPVPGEIAGFFQLFHTIDPRAQGRPLLNPMWIHAGNYDSEFCFRWPKENRIILPMVVRHMGQDGQNWMGAGNNEEMAKMRLDRQRGKNWRDERIDVAPTIGG